MDRAITAWSCMSGFLQLEVSQRSSYRLIPLYFSFLSLHLLLVLRRASSVASKEVLVGSHELCLANKADQWVHFRKHVVLTCSRFARFERANVANSKITFAFRHCNHLSALRSVLRDDRERRDTRPPPSLPYYFPDRGC